METYQTIYGIIILIATLSMVGAMFNEAPAGFFISLLAIVILSGNLMILDIITTQEYTSNKVLMDQNITVDTIPFKVYVLEH